jgi:tetratricopeptide (TPR) repeat protein
MPRSPRTEALELAERAYALVDAKPLQASMLAEQALELARKRRDPEARVAALHALGFARFWLGDPRALATMRTAVRAGERAGDVRRVALARRNIALGLAYRGRAAQAVAEIETAQAALTGIDRARTEVFRIAVFHLAGRAREAWPASSEALRVLRRDGDTAWEARLLYNRGSSLAEVGDASAARRDLERARDLYAQLGSTAAVADARITLGRLRLVEGDVLDGLAELDAIDVGELSEWAACWLYLSRAEAFVALRLLPEARADFQRFVEASTRAHAVDSVNKARLEAARLALIAGDPAAATALAANRALPRPPPSSRSPQPSRKDRRALRRFGPGNAP